MSPDDPRHGKNAGYIAGCREQCCKDAHAAYKRGLWRKRYARRVTALYIDSTGTQRRIQALAALGWTYREMNAVAGWSTNNPGGNAHNILRQLRVHVDTAETIRRVYDQLSMRVPTGRYVTRARRIAYRKGWVPPLMWDDDTIDDPTATPARPRPPMPPGRDRRHYADGTLLAEWDHLRESGVSIHAAARQLGVTVGAIERAQERARALERQAS